MFVKRKKVNVNEFKGELVIALGPEDFKNFKSGKFKAKLLISKEKEAPLTYTDFEKIATPEFTKEVEVFIEEVKEEVRNYTGSLTDFLEKVINPSSVFIYNDDNDDDKQIIISTAELKRISKIKDKKAALKNLLKTCQLFNGLVDALEYSLKKNEVVENFIVMLFSFMSFSRGSAEIPRLISFSTTVDGIPVIVAVRYDLSNEYLNITFVPDTLKTQAVVNAVENEGFFDTLFESVKEYFEKEAPQEAREVYNMYKWLFTSEYLSKKRFVKNLIRGIFN